MAPEKHIVVLGSLNMDLVMETSRMPAPGETMHGKQFRSSPGGKGLNQAVAAARLLQGTDVKVYMVGRVGDDEFSDRLISGLVTEGIDVSQVKQVKGKASGVALIIVEQHTGQNRIILSTDDANNAFYHTELDSLTPLIQSSSLLICQFEIPFETVQHALSIAHAAGVPTILNPAPGLPHLPPSLYKTVDYLIPNETEAEILLGSDFRIDDISSALDGAMELMRRGVRKAVIVTLGEKGIVIVKADGQLRTFPARDVPKVVDATGAGDCFVGGFAVGLVERRLAVEGAANIGLAAAALAVQKKGARDSMPYRSDMAWSGN